MTHVCGFEPQVIEVVESPWHQIKIHKLGTSEVLARPRCFISLFDDLPAVPANGREGSPRNFFELHQPECFV